MGNIISLMPFGGIAVLILSIFRTLGRVIRSDKPFNIMYVFSIFVDKIRLFLVTEYRLLTILFLSAGTFTFLQKYQSHLTFAWYLPILTGILTSIFLIVLITWLRGFVLSKIIRKNNLLYCFIDILTSGNGLTNTLTLICYLSINIFFITHHSIYDFIEQLRLLSGFALGAAGTTFTILLVDPFYFEKFNRANKKAILTTIHFDTLLIIVVASLLLSTTLTFNRFALLLPVLIACLGLLSSLISKWLGEKFILFSFEKVISALLNSGAALFFITWLLPEYWVSDSVEYSRTGVFYVSLIGIWGGFLLGKISVFYQWIASKNKINHPIYKKILHFTLQTPTLIILTGILLYIGWLAFIWVGIYGIMICLTAMFSHIDGELTSELI